MKELKELWDEMCEQCGSTREFIDSKPNLIIVVPKYIKLKFWKIKKEIKK